jgi:hypothetical protein
VVVVGRLAPRRRRSAFCVLLASRACAGVLNLLKTKHIDKSEGPKKQKRISK